MRIRQQFLFMLAAFGIFSASATEPEIAKLSWLAGCWASEGAELDAGRLHLGFAEENLVGRAGRGRGGFVGGFVGLFAAGN